MTPGPDTSDKILDHNRLQLSALLDGELSLDEARFLLRRLQHDAELRECWERWQLSGDVLRGQAEVLLPSGFAERVAAAIAAEQSASTGVPANGPRWLRWGGSAALAASVAVFALLLTRHSPDTTAPAMETPAQIVVAMPVPTTSGSPSASSVPTPSIPNEAAQLATAVAVADLPRRINTRRSRGQSQRAAMRTPSRAVAEVPIAVASAVAPVDPFSAHGVGLANRPWPRALLPGSPANGAFTVDYSSRLNHGGATSPSFYPFQPRTVPTEPADTATDGGNVPR